MQEKDLATGLTRLAVIGEIHIALPILIRVHRR